jgi:type I restriction enzyme, S subunit
VEGIDLENLPEGWKEKSFTEVGKLSGGGTPDTNNPSFWNGEIPFFTLITRIKSVTTKQNILIPSFSFS